MKKTILLALVALTASASAMNINNNNHYLDSQSHTTIDTKPEAKLAFGNGWGMGNREVKMYRNNFTGRYHIG